MNSPVGVNGVATVNVIDVTRDRLSVSSHLRMLADLIETGAQAEIPEIVRKPYVSPQLVAHGAIPPAALQALRARRNEAFGADLFGEPGWDMMLELFLAKQQERRLSMKSLTIASNAPQTTAGRYLTQLIDQGFAACTEDPGDGRRKLIGITREGYRKMDELFAKAA